MARSYRNISKYEKEILELKEQGYTLQPIGNKYGFTYDQVHNLRQFTIASVFNFQIIYLSKKIRKK